MKIGETHSLLEKAEKIWQAALAEVAPKNLIGKSVIRKADTLFVQEKRYELSAYENIYLIAFGKAAPAMAESLMDILGNRVQAGLVVALPGQKISLPGINVLEAPHPLPDERSLDAGREILALARAAGQKDLVVILLSGGGSAQACLPLVGISFEDKRHITQELMFRGADIAELNIVRKHLSAIKGGRLADAAFPAEIVNLVISDVIGDDLEAVASGPAHWDSSAFGDALGVLQKYDLWDNAPRSIRDIINEGRNGKLPDTLKKNDRVFEKVSSFIIGNNALALGAARLKAERLGFKTIILTSTDRGEARLAAKIYVSLLVSLAVSGKKLEQPRCFLSGGELIVRVKGPGKGGRNQEFVLAVLSEIERHTESGPLSGRDWLVASLGTDGIDGNTDAAGAWASRATIQKSRELGLDIQRFLDDNDSYHFFQKAGGLIVTGPTGTNVMDLRMFFLADKKGKGEK
jgi:glycerate-2-kinase